MSSCDRRRRSMASSTRSTGMGARKDTRTRAWPARARLARAVPTSAQGTMGTPAPSAIQAAPPPQERQERARRSRPLRIHPEQIAAAERGHGHPDGREIETISIHDEAAQASKRPRDERVAEELSLGHEGDPAGARYHDRRDVERALVIHREHRRARWRDVLDAVHPQAEPSTHHPAAGGVGGALEPPGAPGEPDGRRRAPVAVHEAEQIPHRVRPVERGAGEVHPPLVLHRRRELGERQRVEPDVGEPVSPVDRPGPVRRQLAHEREHALSAPLLGHRGEAYWTGVHGLEPEAGC